MDTVVSRLLDMDRHARQILDEAKQYYDRTVEEIGREKESILKDYTERAEKHLAEAKQAEASQVAEAVANIAASRDERVRALEAVSQENHAAWVDELFRRCVSARGAQDA